MSRRSEQYVLRSGGHSLALSSKSASGGKVDATPTPSAPRPFSLTVSEPDTPAVLTGTSFPCLCASAHPRSAARRMTQIRRAELPNERGLGAAAGAGEAAAAGASTSMKRTGAPCRAPAEVGGEVQSPSTAELLQAAAPADSPASLPSPLLATWSTVDCPLRLAPIDTVQVRPRPTSGSLCACPP